MQLEQAFWPVDVLRLAQRFVLDFPKSPMAPAGAIALNGAQTALQALRSKEVRLYKSSFVIADLDAVSQMQELKKAGRGDKDAAARVARLHAGLGTEVGDLRYEGWLQYATALGNGIASYELALYYRRSQQPLLAAQAQAQARKLGYIPPYTLSHERK